MDDVRHRHRQATEAFGEKVRAVRDDQWDDPTPCTGWTVRDLVAHLVDEHQWAPALLAGSRVHEVGPLPGAGDDPRSAYDEAARGAVEAAAEVDLDASVHLSYGEAPARHYLAEMTDDLVVHGWDLARALGVDDGADPALVEQVLAWAEPRFADRTGLEELFAPPVAVAADADPLTRLLAITGRRREQPAG